jgi:GR25 family glycosyltransferase involved in LPS biosynthesis
MPSLRDFHILYINLDNRKDRKKNIEKQLKELGLKKRSNFKTKRIKGVIGPDIKHNYKQLAKEFNVLPEQMKESFWLSRKNFKTMSNDKKKVLGRVGCFLGHLRALQYAYKHNLQNVIIFEDDCVFTQNKSFIFPTPPKNNDIFYLGGLFGYTNKSVTPTKLNNKWMKINHSIFKLYCTFSYGFSNKKSIENALQLYRSVWILGKGKEHPKDWKSGKERIRATSSDHMYINFIQRHGNAYVLIQPICIQSDAFVSDVTDLGKITPKTPYTLEYYFKNGKNKKKNK